LGLQLEGMSTPSASSPAMWSQRAPPSPHDEEAAATPNGGRRRSPERQETSSPTSLPVRRHATSPTSPPPSLSPLDATSTSVPAVPINHRYSRSISSPATSDATPHPSSSASNFLLHMPPALMKLLMVLSLYALLAYTWNTDLKVQYKSMEINYDLSKYWHGEGRILGVIDAKTMTGVGQERVARRVQRSNSDSDGILGLISALVEEEKASADASETRAGEGEYAPASLPSNLDARKRRPSLSYARSSTAFPRPRRASAAGAVRHRPLEPAWTLSNVAWGLVWLAFLLPIAEAVAREARRQVNFQFWNVRRLRGLRAAPRQVLNAHDL